MFVHTCVHTPMHARIHTCVHAHMHAVRDIACTHESELSRVYERAHASGQSDKSVCVCVCSRTRIASLYALAALPAPGPQCEARNAASAASTIAPEEARGLGSVGPLAARDAPEGSWSTLASPSIVTGALGTPLANTSSILRTVHPFYFIRVLSSLHGSHPRFWQIPTNALASVHSKSSALLEQRTLNIEHYGLLLILSKCYPQLSAGLGLTLAISKYWSAYSKTTQMSLLFNYGQEPTLRLFARACSNK